MHFVKKVGTTEEQKAKKQKENEAKLKIYIAGRDRIFEKRRKDELDEEMLSLTAKMLEKNPDIYTFWNIRRQTFTKMRDKMDGKPEGEVAEKMDGILRNEMILTQSCLTSNPKSYSAWHHRAWTVNNLSKVDTEHELKLCEKMLKFDDRNFHCWDYRRFIVQYANQSSAEEMKFSRHLIEKNFSNYSSWHYRSVLLQKLKKEFFIDTNIIEAEYSLLENSFYVDPEDQSAWIYAEWLFTSNSQDTKGQPKVLSLMFDFPNGNPYKAEPIMATIVFDRAIDSSMIAKYLTIELQDSKPELIVDKKSIVEGFNRHMIFQFDLKSKFVKCILSSELDESGVNIDPEIGYVNLEELYHIYHIKRKPIAPARREIIKHFANDCLKIYTELQAEERRNEHLKWPLYCQTIALMVYDPINNNETILKNLKQLIEIDPKRAEMYNEITTRLKINEMLRDGVDRSEPMIDKIIKRLPAMHDERIKVPELMYYGELKLCGMGIRCVDHLKYLGGLIRILDLSNNQIQGLRGFEYLRRLHRLVLDRNPINDLRYLSKIVSLEYLSVKGTQVAKKEDMKEVQLLKIRLLNYDETKLAENREESYAFHANYRYYIGWARHQLFGHSV